MNGYRYAGAACQGTLHIRNQMPCQDVVSGWVDEAGAVAVLADGAGSCEHALEGARSSTAAAEAVLREWCISREELSEQALKRKVLTACLDALKANSLPPHSQASTLLFAAVRRDGEYCCGHIGDGYVFVTDGTGAGLLSDAENGDEPNITFFVTSATAMEHFRMTCGRLEAGQAIVLCSDGAGSTLYDKGNGSCAEAVSRMAQWLKEHPQDAVESALERNMDTLMRKYTTDDMSIGVVLYADAQKEREGD